MNKKPPDKYRTVKCSIKSIVKSDFDYNKLFDACFRSHQIVIHTYQLLRLWILNKYHNNTNIPLITDETIKMAFKTIIKDSQGPKPKGSNLDLYTELSTLLETEYKHLNYESKLDGKNLSQILGYLATDMLTNIENNIKLHFTKYLKRFVNSSFKIVNNELLSRCERGTKTALRKELNKDLFDIKQDLINNTLKSNSKYHEWINIHKVNIFPSEYNASYEFDITINPQNYLKGMIYMCLEIEKLNTKAFQFFPLRTNIIMKYIPIDSKSIVELFIEEDKNSYLLDIEGKKNELWNKFFNLNNPIFKQKNYSFDYRISTDCFAVSIQLINNDFIQKEIDKKKNMKNKKKEIKEQTKGMTQEEKEYFKENLNKIKKENLVKIKLENKIKKDQQKETYKKLSKEDKLEMKLEIKKNKPEKYIEFPYLEELSDIQYNSLKNNNWVVCDPGRKNLLYMMNENGETLKYSNKQHMHKTKRLKYQRLIHNYKNANGISSIENNLSLFNSKSCIIDNFKNYINKKNELNKVLLEKYKEDIFRKYKWYSYINRKKAETDIVREIKNKFGNDTTIIMGDWSDKLKTLPSRIKYISTPNISLKRKIHEYIDIYNLDEFRTSCLNNKTENRCENIELLDKKGVMRKIHSVLTFQMENNRRGCINRDNNVVLNMIKIVKSYLENKTRPERYRRDFKIE